MKLSKRLLAISTIAGLALLAAYTLRVPAPAYAGDTGTIVGQLTGKRKYVKDAVVYIDGVTTKAPKEWAQYDQKNQKFTPHVLAVVKGTTVSFLNSDDTGHNVYSPDHETYDLGTWGKGETKEYVHKNLGAYTQLCKLHPSMLGYIVTVPNRYFAVTGNDGQFEITGVPAGTYTLKVWQEKGKGNAVKVTVSADKKAKVKIEMKK